VKRIEINRRQFLATLAAAGLSPLCIATPFGAGEKPSASATEMWVSAQGNSSDKYSLGWVDADARPKSTSGRILSGYRGHGLAYHPTKPNKVVMFSRRPGRVGMELDVLTGKIEHRFYSTEGRHQSGHGCFSSDGAVLFVCETLSSSGKGNISVLDAKTYQCLNQFDSYGIGPHEIKLMPDNRTLVIANGGLHQSPKSGQGILNLESMESNLSYVDSVSGELISKHRVTEPKASIRHLDVADDGTVALAMQVQRAAMSSNRVVPLGAVHKQGKPIELLAEPNMLIAQMHDYMGSVAINSTFRIAGFSSPRGNVTAFWHLDSHQLLGYHAFHDVCGLAVTQDQQRFVLTNSFGQLRQLNAHNLQEQVSQRLQFPDMQWDNHLSVIPTRKA